MTIDRHGEPIAIDVRIAPLIEALWARAIATVSSCEETATSEHGVGLPAGAAYVAFPDRHDARRFARTCRGGRAVDPAVVLLPSVGPEDLLGDELGIEPGTTTVVFPTARIEIVTARLQ